MRIITIELVTTLATLAPAQAQDVRFHDAQGRVTPALSASLIGRLGQALSDYPPLQCRCRPRARASLRTRHKALPSWGFEDEVEQSFGRPRRQHDGRSKRTNDLTSSIVP